MFVTDTEEIGSGSRKVAVYWIGDEKNERQFGVCFECGYFNIARQSIAESIPTAMEVADAAIQTIPEETQNVVATEFTPTWYTSITTEDAKQLLHDAANLRDYSQSVEPAGAARAMVEVAEHLEEMFDNGK